METRLLISVGDRSPFVFLIRIDTGTGALNSQFILTGHHHGEKNRETVLRKLVDGVNALGRYYLNNFADAYRQDDYDIFLGNHRGESGGVVCMSVMVGMAET